MEVTPGAAPAIISKMPLVDLTSLAPEKQQAVSQVTEGWKEKEGTTTTAKPTATTSLRDIVQRIHGTCNRKIMHFFVGFQRLKSFCVELKSEIRKFEEDFTSKHGHKVRISTDSDFSFDPSFMYCLDCSLLALKSHPSEHSWRS